MMTEKRICRSSVELTAREYEQMRTSIVRIQRLGIRDNRLTNLTNRMSLNLKKASRRNERKLRKMNAYESA